MIGGGVSCRKGGSAYLFKSEGAQAEAEVIDKEEVQKVRIPKFIFSLLLTKICRIIRRRRAPKGIAYEDEQGSVSL